MKYIYNLIFLILFGKVARAYVESRSDGKNATVTINNIKMTELPVSVTRMVSRISFTAIKNITKIFVNSDNWIVIFSEISIQFLAPYLDGARIIVSKKNKIESPK